MTPNDTQLFKSKRLELTMTTRQLLRDKLSYYFWRSAPEDETLIALMHNPHPQTMMSYLLFTNLFTNQPLFADFFGGILALMVRSSLFNHCRK